MRGPLEGVDPLFAPVLFSFQQAREDIAKYAEGLTTEQLWARPFGFGSVGFHIRHIARSTERLLCYAQGGQLTAEQLAELKSEHDAGDTLEAVLSEMDARFRAAEQWIRTLDRGSLTEARGVGRKMLPTTVIGLLVHTAEHTQRHVGQCISAAKLIRQQDILKTTPQED